MTDTLGDALPREMAHPINIDQMPTTKGDKA
jgi:hypothetical protein